MKIVGYDPTNKIIDLNEFDSLVICHTVYRYGNDSYGTLSFVDQDIPNGKYYLIGVKIPRDETFQIANNTYCPIKWTNDYNYGHHDILQLMIDKFRYQRQAIHIWYIIENLDDLNWIDTQFNLCSKGFQEFREALQSRYRQIFGDNQKV